MPVYNWSSFDRWLTGATYRKNQCSVTRLKSNSFIASNPCREFQMENYFVICIQKLRGHAPQEICTFTNWPRNKMGNAKKKTVLKGDYVRTEPYKRHAGRWAFLSIHQTVCINARPINIMLPPSHFILVFSRYISCHEQQWSRLWSHRLRNQFTSKLIRLQPQSCH